VVHRAREAARTSRLVGPVTEPTSSGTSSLRRALVALLRADRLLAHNLVVGVGTVAAGVLGVAFQSLASHQLRPADYGAVFAVVTILTLVGLPAGAFTLLMARETSRGIATGLQAESATLLRHGNRLLLLLGLAIAIALVLGSSWLSRFLDVPFELLLAAA